MRRTLAAVAAGGLFVCAPVAGLVAARAAPRHDSPPECVKLRIVENSGRGPVLYLLACGTGGQGESPVFDQLASRGPLVVDGGPLTPAACQQDNRCVIVWPRSPGEGTWER